MISPLLAACSAAQIPGFPHIFNSNYSIIKPLSAGENYQSVGFVSALEEYRRDVISSDDITFSEYLNFMPAEARNRHNIEAYRVLKTSKRSGDQEYYFFFFCKGKLIKANDLTGRGKSAFTQFLFTDIDGDGYSEVSAILSLSYGCQVCSINTKDGTSASAISPHGVMLYFDKDPETGFVSIFKEPGVRDPDNIVRWSTIVPWKRAYKMSKNEYLLQSKNYKVKVTSDPSNSGFPLIYEGVFLEFAVTVEMTYMGETFSYQHWCGYKDGALATFTSGDEMLHMEGWGATDDMPWFTVSFGEVITRTYHYTDSFSQQNPKGIYDMTISYRGETITKRNVLTVS